jgi:hypothetical protein
MGSLGYFFFALQPHSFCVVPPAILVPLRIACHFPSPCFSTKISGIAFSSSRESAERFMMHLFDDARKIICGGPTSGIGAIL